MSAADKRLLVVGLVLTLGIRPGHAIESITYVSAAQLFVQNIYPELSGQDIETVTTIVAPLDTVWNEHPIVDVHAWPRTQHDVMFQQFWNVDRQFLYGSITFEPNRSIRTASFVGSFVHSTELTRVREALSKKTEPAEIDVIVALANAGAKYPPRMRAAFVRDVQLGRFQRFVGTILESTVQFQWTIENGRQPPSIVSPSWIVELKALLDGRNVCYDLRFEPIDGRFAHMFRYECG